MKAVKVSMRIRRFPGKINLRKKIKRSRRTRAKRVRKTKARKRKAARVKRARRAKRTKRSQKMKILNLKENKICWTDPLYHFLYIFFSSFSKN